MWLESGGDAHEEETEEVEEEGQDEVEVDKEEGPQDQEAAQEGARSHLIAPGGQYMETEWIRREFERLSLVFHTSRGKTLVISDPHIGFEFSRGLRLRTHFEEKLASFIQEKDPDLLIILGDVKEPIGLSFAVKRILVEFFSSLKDINIVITKGNHDGRIEEATSSFQNISVLDYLLLDGSLYLHGHTNLPPAEFREGYLGHIHPAYTVGSPGKKTKVFTRVGRFLILPTINPYIEGFDVRQGIKMVPFLRWAKELDLFLPEGIYLGKVQLEKQHE